MRDYNEDSRPVVILAQHTALHRRWLDVVYMRQRANNAPLAPRWMRFQDVADVGIGWIELMEQWEKDRFAGQAPISFEQFVSHFGPRRPGRAP